MIIDDFFTIGSTHETCEDYTLSGQIGNIGYAILSDGCSACQDTDVGSRLLCLSARKNLARLIEKYDGDITKVNLLELEQPLITDINDTSDNLIIYRGSFFATLIIAIYDEHSGICKVQMFGDGTFAIFNDKNKITSYTIDFDSSAPYYLTHKLDGRDEWDYLRGFNQCYNIKKTIIDMNDESEEINTKNDETIRKPNNKEFYKDASFEFSGVDGVAIFSDGIDSFVKNIEDKHNHSRIHSNNIIKKVLHFNNKKGRFVKRRMDHVLGELKKDNVVHYDDFSNVTILGKYKNEEIDLSMFIV